MSTGGSGEIRTKLGLDVEPFRRGIAEAREGVRSLQAEMRRGRATELAEEQRAAGRRQRSADQAHQHERRARVEAMMMWRQYQGVVEKAADVIASRFGETMRKVQREEENTIETTEEMFQVMGDASVAFSAFHKGVEILEGVTRAFEAAEERAAQASAAAKEYFASLRGEASLTGQPGVTSSVLSSNLLMSLRTGMSNDEASAFVQMFESSLPAGMQKGNITREVADEFAVAAAEMLTRQGADPQTRGDLAGMIANFQEVGSAGEGLAALEAVRVGLVEGRGFDKPLTDALLQVAGQFVSDAGSGMVPTLPELSAMIGVTSLSAGSGAAGTRVEQLVRLLQGTTAETMSFLKGFGVESDMNLMERLDVLVPQFRKLDEQAGGGANLYEQLLGVGFTEEELSKRKNQIAQSGNVYELLVSAGFSAEGLKALNEMIPAYDTLKTRIAKAQQPMDGAQVEALNRQFLGSDLGQALRAEQFKMAAERISGVREMDADTAIRIAEGQSILAGEQQSGMVGLLDWARPLMHGMPVGAERGQRLRMQGRALDTMRGQLREAGLLDEYRSEVLGISGPVAGGGPGGFVANPGRAMTYREEINAMLDFMREKGLEPFEQAFGQGEALAKAIDSSAQLTQEQTAALGSLGVDIQALRDTIDRTYKQQARGPVQPPQAPPPGRGR